MYVNKEKAIILKCSNKKLKILLKNLNTSGR